MDLTISFRVTKRNVPGEPIIFVDASTKTIKVYNRTIKGELEMQGVAIPPIDAQTLNLGPDRSILIQTGKTYKDEKEFLKAAKAIKYYYYNRFDQNNYILIEG